MEENTVKFTLSAKNWDEYFTIKSKKLLTHEATYESGEIYTLKLHISSLNYGNYYAWQLITNQIVMSNVRSFDHNTHPFDNIERSEIHMCKDNKTIYIGGINAKNEVMDSLFKMIMMSDKELSENSGNIDHSHYRAHLIEILFGLWD